MNQKYILTIDCPERIGIVRAVTNLFYEQGFSVVEAAEFADLDKQMFFARWAFAPGEKGEKLPPLDEVKALFAPLGTKFQMNWKMRDSDVRPRILIAVSRFGHCLNDLLHRWQEEEDFPADIVGVVSNHDVFRDKVEWYKIPFYYLPVTSDTKQTQERQILDIIEQSKVELLVLARYMQILSEGMCRQLEGRAINIHHSFLPGFKGARPYHQAYERGVKISGATAHYVTANLDEGPIIEQDVQRVEHHYSPEMLARLGKHIENVVLMRAIYWHCQQRIIVDGNRTIIFK